jgi:hypothetical protein
MNAMKILSDLGRLTYAIELVVHISIQLTELTVVVQINLCIRKDLNIHAYKEQVQELTMALPKASAA